MFRTAFQFIRYDRAKSIGIIVGIVISTFLIGQQLATLQFLTRIMVGLMDNTNPKAGEIWVIDNSAENVDVLAQIDNRLVREIKSIDGVAQTYPIVIAKAKMMLKNGKSSAVTLVGSEAPLFMGGPNPTKIAHGNLSDLANSGMVSVEYFDAKNLDPSLQVGTKVEVNGHSAIIKLGTQNTQAFATHYMYTNIDNARFLGNFPLNKVSIITVKLKDGADIRQVTDRINRTFSGIRAWDIEELKRSTVRNILITTNMGITFGTLVIFAVITGFFIIGLTMYSSVLDRINDYGTLKAIGARNKYVRKLILTQAVIFALTGFLLAMMLLMGMKQGMANAGLILDFNPPLLGILLFITLLISVGGSLFAIGKINKLEPASVFR
ncbi:MAG: ABC transporter permease [Saprospiraceae bacterium]|nr:ABC transporter permease [Saprospiraceae bacterium]